MTSIPRRVLILLASFGVASIAAAQDTKDSKESSETKYERCSKSFGTLAVTESQSGYGHLQQYGLGSPAALLRIMVQKSGCFDVVERGAGMEGLRQERALAQSGDLRQESNVGQGQMQAADFVLTPQVQIGAQNTGGIGGALGGLTRSLGVLGAIAGGLRFKEASTSIVISDVRSSLQVAAAEGKARKTDFNIASFGVGGGVAGALGGYTNSPEGKVVAASLLDNYNKIVLQIREQTALIKPSSAAGDANAAASTRAQAPQRAGELLTPRLGNLRVHDQPSRDANVVATLQRGDEFIASGQVKDGFIHVDGASVSGWVQRTLVGPPAGGAPPPQALAPAPVAAPLPSGAGMPAIGAGTVFVGSFAGSDQGTFQLTLKRDGGLMGTGSSPQMGNFIIGGKIDSDGSVMLSAGINPLTGNNAVFIGQVGPNRDSFSGNWQFSGSRQGNGTFVAQIRR